jgi:hypothetical protein
MKLSAMAAGSTAIDVEHFDRIIHHHPFLRGFWLPACLPEVTTRPQLPVGPPPLPNALHFIIEALIVGISLFRANEIQDREHIFGLQPQEAHNFAALDLEFHITIARASGNSLLFDLVSMIRGQLVGGLSNSSVASQCHSAFI